MSRFRHAVLGLMLLVLASGCMHQTPKVPANAPLYDRLGGEKGITAVTEEFLTLLDKDSRIDLERKNTAHPFQKTPANMAVLKIRAVALLSKATGGPDYYAQVGGRDMPTAHRGMGISEAEWQAGVDDLTTAMKNKHVGDREQKEVLAAVGGLKPQIVGK